MKFNFIERGSFFGRFVCGKIEFKVCVLIQNQARFCKIVDCLDFFLIYKATQLSHISTIIYLSIVVGLNRTYVRFLLSSLNFFFYLNTCFFRFIV